MIALALVMIRARPAHAVTIFLLSLLAIGAAVAAPAYVHAAGRSIGAVDLAAAGPAEQALVVAVSVPVRADGDPALERAVANSRNHPFDKTATAAILTPGFDTVFASTFEVAAVTRLDALVGAVPEQRLEFREGFCGHVDLTQGRCVAGPGEVLVGTRQAASLGVGPGSGLIVEAVQEVPPNPDNPGGFVADGVESVLSVVGVYRVHDDSDLYWGNLFGITASGGSPQPLLVDRSTLSSVDHGAETQSVVAYARPGTLTADRLGALRADLAATEGRLAAASLNPVTSIKALLNRMEADRRQAATTPGVAAIPLILLCCFVVFLAAASTVQDRRVELGMLKLRGALTVDRWWLAGAEIVLPVLAGAAAGYVAGQAAVWIFVRFTLSAAPPFTLTTDALPQAVLALVAAVGAGLLALRRDLATPAVELLRRVPSRSQRWGGAVVRTIAVVLAVAAVVQLRSPGGGFTGISLLAPALVILAVALVCAAAFDPLVRWWGGRALRRGRLGLALGALHLGRRRGGSRVLALLIVAVGLVGFAATAFEIGDTARGTQVTTSLGADRVVTLSPMRARELLYAVRQVDPAGDYAMAVMPLEAKPERLKVLALDSTRLATAARWPGLAGGAAQAESTLRPQVAEPVVVRGTGLTLRARLAAATIPDEGHLPFGLLTVTASLSPLDGSKLLFARFPALRRGDGTYQVAVQCPVGCRLMDLTIQPYLGEPMTVTLASLRQTGPDTDLATAADLALWRDRQTAVVKLEPGAAGGLAVTVDGSRGRSDGAVGPADVPDSALGVPGVVAGQSLAAFQVPAPSQFGGVAAQRSATTSLLPRVGTRGALVDLEFLTRLAEPGPSDFGEVWLGPAAPPDVLDRLRAAGLTVLTDRRLDTELTSAKDRPNAVGVRFFLVVGVLCLVLGAGGLAVSAGVERRSRADELRALRAQGLRRRTAARAGRISYLIMVLAAGALGAVAAAIAWLTTGDHLPLVDVLVPGLATPRWPAPSTLWAVAAAVLVLVVAAVGSGWALSHAAKQNHTRRSTS